MRTLSLPLDEYQKDLQRAEAKGFKEAFRRFNLIVEQSKKDKTDAVMMIVEDFEDNQASIDQMVALLGLRVVAKDMWSNK